jgi:hypothetical protein
MRLNNCLDDADTYTYADYFEESTVEDNTPPDCLVLEIYANNELVDERKRIFVWYDSVECRFFLRGKADDSESISYNPFNFKSKKASHIADFLSLIINKRAILEVALYNFTDFSLSSNDITFEMLEANENAEVIYMHDDYPLKRDKLKYLLNMLSNIYNSY